MQGLTELTPALIRENRRHHATSYVRGRELGSNDRAQRIITSYAQPELRGSHIQSAMNTCGKPMRRYTHDEPPNDQGGQYVYRTDGSSVCREGLTECTDDYDNEFDAIWQCIRRNLELSISFCTIGRTHSLPTSLVCDVAESQLAYERSQRRRGFHCVTETGFPVFVQSTLRAETPT